MNELKTHERVLLGMLGAVIVAVATYPLAEKGYADLVLKPDFAELLGFLIRLIGMAAIGAIWGYIHRPETDPRRALQLGMVAPAAVAGMIYANLDRTTDQGLPETTAKAAELRIDGTALSLIGSARAADGIIDIPIYVPPLSPTFIDRVVKGVFGK